MIILTVAERTSIDALMSIASLEKARRAAGGRFLEDDVLYEVRFDAFDEIEDGFEVLGLFGRRVLATFRSVEHGGRGHWSKEERAALIVRAAEFAGAIDLEWPADAAIQTPPGSKRILSHHDVRGTPEHLDLLTARMSESAVDRLKVVVTPNDLRDLARIFAAQRKWRSIATIFGLGELGVASRYALFGEDVRDELFYASASAKRAAPGQPTFAELMALPKLIYRTGVERRLEFFGLIGDPTSHSLSPCGMNAAFEHAKDRAVYVTLPTPTFDGWRDLVREAPFRGFSITAPHKVAALSAADRLTDGARQVGAINTLVREADGAWIGVNTDVDGVAMPVARAFAAAGRSPAGRGVVVGTGGAGRAAAVALRSLGLETFLAGRDPLRTEEIARSLGVRAIWSGDPARTGEPFDVVVHATPLGGAGDPDGSAVQESFLGPGTIVLDMNYRPEMTPLMQLAAAKKCRGIPGIAMFIAQGRRQVRWFCAEEGAEDRFESAVRARFAALAREVHRNAHKP